MGCNYYLYKKDNSKWTLPVINLGNQLETLAIKMFNDKTIESNESISLNLQQCVIELDKLHIGKSSIGWHFSLCIYPVLSIYTLEDWKKLFSSENYIIKDEFDVEVSVDDMLDCITNRSSIDFDKFESVTEYEEHFLEETNELLSVFDDSKHYNTYDELLKDSNADRGYKGLLCHKSHIFDYRNEKQESVPVLSNFYSTDETYDLTTNWDFE